MTFEDLPIKNSPFQIEVVPGCDPSRVLVFGEGLKGGFTNQQNNFIIDLDGAGQGNLGLAIEGPSDAKINCVDNLDGTCTVEYSSTVPGTYDIYIKFNDIDVKGMFWTIACYIFIYLRIYGSLVTLLFTIYWFTVCLEWRNAALDWSLRVGIWSSCSEDDNIWMMLASHFVLDICITVAM